MCAARNVQKEDLNEFTRNWITYNFKANRTIPKFQKRGRVHNSEQKNVPQWTLEVEITKVSLHHFGKVILQD